MAWAHPTTGSAQACAPSLFVDPFALIEGLHEFLADGDVIAATDYSGMGAIGSPSYLIGTTEGNNVLDSVRAARALRDAHAATRLLLWGHSQGGQATLFAAAADYAPELHLVGVAVAAPQCSARHCCATTSATSSASGSARTHSPPTSRCTDRR